MSGDWFPGFDLRQGRTALIDEGRALDYGELARRCRAQAIALLGDRNDLDEERIGLLLPAGADYVAGLHGIWQAGGIAVPLSPSVTGAELDHYLSTAGITRLLAGPDVSDSVRAACQERSVALIAPSNNHAPGDSALPELGLERRAMILFTSGTTSRPKGVVIARRAIQAQVTTLMQAWEWSAEDVIPCFLPLHHIHGIINVLSCALWSGAQVHMMPRLEVGRLCEEVAAGAYSVFMAVPTVYVKLLEHFSNLDSAMAGRVKAGFARMRLNVSGSAACPVELFKRWEAATGQVLLERYGMTEIGMALSNPYRGERRAGHVGSPLPGVEVALFDEQNQPVTATGMPGEIRIKGATVFREYWGNPEATAASFHDGWFCSGDVAVIEDGYFRIMGRSSIDIIKSGGYKLSALEIEGVLLDHPLIREVAVIGLPDATWGELVAAVVVLQPGASLELETLRAWCADRLSPYKVPRALHVTEALPRNAMGKVTKPELRKLC
ncbi:MAG: acyl-CoA synthetase [Steroidobacteraceae bacterium]